MTPVTGRSASLFWGGPGSAVAPADLAILAGLKLTEIMFDARRPGAAELARGFSHVDLFDFLELTNVGSKELDLSDLVLSGSVTFEFGAGAITTLAPGESVLVVGDRDAFAFRYGEGLPVSGAWKGKLNARGESTRASSFRLDTREVSLIRLVVQNQGPWPALVGGRGYSLDRARFTRDADGEDPASWIASAQIDGSPGTTLRQTYDAWVDVHFADDEVIISGPEDDPDGDGLANLLEYAFGRDPRVKAETAHTEVRVSSSGLTVSHPRPMSVTDVDYRLEVSSDLQEWQILPTDAYTKAVTRGDGGKETVSYHLESMEIGKVNFVRVRISLKD